jgi:hypothetical protein
MRIKYRSVLVTFTDVYVVIADSVGLQHSSPTVAAPCNLLEIASPTYETPDLNFLERCRELSSIETLPETSDLSSSTNGGEMSPVECGNEVLYY